MPTVRQTCRRCGAKDNLLSMKLTRARGDGRSVLDYAGYVHKLPCVVTPTAPQEEK